MKRRDFILAATTAAVAASLARSTANAATAPNTAGARPESIAAIIARSARRSRPRVLLRSSWQSIDTGDVAHTPGALRLLERHVPSAEVTLWPSPGRFSEGTREMLGRIFPRLQIAEGDVTADGKPTTQSLADAWERADFFLHSSGSSLVGRAHLAAWRKATQRPYGIYSITVDPVSFFTGGQIIEGGSLEELEKELRSPEVRSLDPGIRTLFDEGAFLYCRDTLSLAYLQSQKVKAAVLGFGPDTVFSWDIQNRAKAHAYLAEARLTAGKYLCLVPRLRYTPYYKEYRFEPTAGDRRKEVVSERWADAEAAKMADIITRWVQQTRSQVVITPEFPYEIEVGERWFNKLAADIRPSVVRRCSRSPCDCHSDFQRQCGARPVYEFAEISV